MWECSECDVENDLDPDVEEEQIVICVECGAEFEVISLDPLELQMLDLVPVADDSDADADYDGDDDDDRAAASGSAVDDTDGDTDSDDDSDDDEDDD